MFFAPPFEGPNRLIARARLRADELEASLTILGNELTMDFLEEPSENGLKKYIVQFSQQPTIDMSLTLRESLNNLRVALDIVVCDAAIVHEFPKERINQIKFPFGKDETALTEALKRMKLPIDIQNFIWAIHPARIPHNRWIRDLHDIDIISKHRVILPVYAASPGSPPFRLPEAMNQLFISQEGIDFNNLTVHWTQGSIVMLREGVDPRASYHPKGPVQLRIPVGFPFADRSIVELLRYLANSVEVVIRLFFDMFSPDGNPANRHEIRTSFGLP